MSTIVEDSKNNNNMDIYEQHGLVKLVCMNSSIILLGMLCMALTLVALIWAMQLRTPIIFAMGSMAKEGGVFLLLPFILALFGCMVGYMQSSWLVKQVNWAWAMISGIYWAAAFFGSIVLFAIVDIVEERFELHVPITNLWLDLLCAAIMGGLIGYGQYRYRRSSAANAWRWVLINALSYLLATGIAYLLRILQTITL